MPKKAAGRPKKAAGKAAKRAASKGREDPVKKRTKMVGEALEETEDLPERVMDILVSTLNVTVAKPKADRHPFNDRLVVMIGEIFDGQLKALEKNLAEKQAKFDEVSPAKGTRESELEDAQKQEHENKDAFDKAKEAMTEHGAKVKEAAAEVVAKKKAQAAGDESLNGISQKKESINSVKTTCLDPLLEGAVPKEERDEKIGAVLTVGKSFAFDNSLMQAVVQVLEKDKDDRTGFDETCTDQIKEAFVSRLQKFDEELQEGAPAKAERLAAVEAAEAAKADADAKQAELVQKLQEAKEAKEAATEAFKTAKQRLADFLPEVKDMGEELEEAKVELEDFTTGPLVSFNELKDWKEGQFATVPEAADPNGEATEGAEVEQQQQEDA
jgi:hypothetical protein